MPAARLPTVDVKAAAEVCVPEVTLAAPVSVGDVPYRKPTDTEVAVPRAVVAPFRAAPDVVIVVAALVVTDGGVPLVVKLMIAPWENPAPLAQASK